MIVENKLDCVAMLCNVIEGGKVRCFDYTANRNAEARDENAPITITRVELQDGEYIHLHYS